MSENYETYMVEKIAHYESEVAKHVAALDEYKGKAAYYVNEAVIAGQNVLSTNNMLECLQWEWEQYQQREVSA